MNAQASVTAKPSGAQRAVRFVLPVIVLAAGLLAWELVVRIREIPPYVLPAPSVIFVTHSVFESVYLSQRVVVMTARPGRIQADIRIETVEPRGEEFRTSVAYSDYCRKVSAALAPSYAGQSTL